MEVSSYRPNVPRSKGRKNTVAVLGFYTKGVTFYTKAFQDKISYNSKQVSYNMPLPGVDIGLSLIKPNAS